LSDRWTSVSHFDAIRESAPPVSTRAAYEAERAQILREFGNGVRALREQKAAELQLPYYGQDKLGEDAELHRTEIGKIERAETEPGLLTLMILAKGLGVTLNDLVEGLPVPEERKPPPGRRDR
jgi:DNA-binding XRE family transcriptional regulator